MNRLINKCTIMPVVGLLTCALTSCNFRDNPVVMEQEYHIGLNYHEASVMVGDTLRLVLDIMPDDDMVKQYNKCFWRRSGNAVTLFVRDACHIEALGTQPGDSWVTVTPTFGQESDSCLVHVISRWDETALSPADYEYDMMVIADVSIDGIHNASGVSVAAYLGNEVRGIGEVRVSHGITYTAIRVYSHSAEGETVTFRYYDRMHCTHGVFDTTVTFDGNHHGTLTDPLLLKN